jgi:hypothetical protein
MSDQAGRPGRAAGAVVARWLVRSVWLLRWWRAGVPLVAVAVTVLAGSVPAAAAAASSDAVADRVPGEVALLGVCGAVVVALAALMIRRARARRWRLVRGHLDAARAARAVAAESDAPELDVAQPATAQMNAVRQGAAELGSAEADAVKQGAAELGAAEADAVRQGAAELGAAEADAVRQGAAELGTAELGAPELGAPELGAAEPDTAAGNADGAGNPGWRVRAALLVPAVAVVVLAGVVAALVVVGSGHRTGTRGSTAAAANPLPGQTPGISLPSAASPASGKHPGHAAAAASPGQSPGQGSNAAPGGSGSGSSAPGRTGPTTSAPTSPTVRVTATSPPPPATPALVVPSTIEVFTTDDGEYPALQGDLTLTATGGPVNYTISVPVADEDYYSFSFYGGATGTVQPGQPVTFEVLITIMQQGGPSPTFVVSPPGQTVGITYA